MIDYRSLMVDHEVEDECRFPAEIFSDDSVWWEPSPLLGPEQRPADPCPPPLRDGVVPLCYMIECLRHGGGWHWTIPALELDGSNATLLAAVAASAAACARMKETLPAFRFPFALCFDPAG